MKLTSPLGIEAIVWRSDYVMFITQIQHSHVDVHLALLTLPLQIPRQIPNVSVCSYKTNMGTAF